ncbi:hypothetical protein GIB67_042989 [Kingdonia uniflora]|uniref:Elongation factor Ts, mitochondrial n=1 Tax=Kingdonia uniflora TaxID=39325 RepID=A0A7J7NT10_9MAGN|nr:hypothetical protein GIB67_042989 [Kingdonia uniflora]
MALSRVSRRPIELLLNRLSSPRQHVGHGYSSWACKRVNIAETKESKSSFASGFVPERQIFMRGFSIEVVALEQLNLIKQLRERTSAPIKDVKTALVGCNWNIEAAQKDLRKRGVVLASKKSSRTAAEGLLAVAENGSRTAIIELNCETDFVARNEIFQHLALSLARIALSAECSAEPASTAFSLHPEYFERGVPADTTVIPAAITAITAITAIMALFTCSTVPQTEVAAQAATEATVLTANILVRWLTYGNVCCIRSLRKELKINLDHPKLSGETTVQNAITEVAAIMGENVKLRRGFAVSKSLPGVISTYLHSSPQTGLGRLAGIVTLEAEDDNTPLDALQRVGSQLAMHVVAAKPLFLSRDLVSSEALDSERDILKSQAESTGKPQMAIERMVEGRLRKYMEEVVLMEQKFIIDDSIFIKSLIDDLSKEVGSPVKIGNFYRMEVGEGIQRQETSSASQAVAQAA